jgi:hypothetical protein
LSHASSGSRRYHFTIFADYHQIYLDDCLVREEISEGLREHSEETADQFAARMLKLDQNAVRIDSLLSPEAQVRHLGVANTTLCILTARALDVSVTVEIRDAPPAHDWSSWDLVVEASVELPSGCVVIHGPTDYLPDASRIRVTPGVYRARVHSGGIASVSTDELEGNDKYAVTLWRAPYAPPEVMYVNRSVAW